MTRRLDLLLVGIARSAYGSLDDGSYLDSHVGHREDAGLMVQWRVSAPLRIRFDYEAVSREFAKQVYGSWGSWVDWVVPTDPRVHGIDNLPLPDGEAPFPGLTSGFDPAGLWLWKP